MWDRTLKWLSLFSTLHMLEKSIEPNIMLSRAACASANSLRVPEDRVPTHGFGLSALVRRYTYTCSFSFVGDAGCPGSAQDLKCRHPATLLGGVGEYCIEVYIIYLEVVHMLSLCTHIFLILLPASMKCAPQRSCTDNTPSY